MLVCSLLHTYVHMPTGEAKKVRRESLESSGTTYQDVQTSEYFTVNPEYVLIKIDHTVVATKFTDENGCEALAASHRQMNGFLLSANGTKLRKLTGQDGKPDKVRCGVRVCLPVCQCACEYGCTQCCVATSFCTVLFIFSIHMKHLQKQQKMSWLPWTSVDVWGVGSRCYHCVRKDGGSLITACVRSRFLPMFRSRYSDLLQGEDEAS